MKIRKEIIEMNSEHGSGVIKKETNAETNKSLPSSVAKSKADGLARWEKGGKIVKGDGSFAFCKAIHINNGHGLEI